MKYLLVIAMFVLLTACTPSETANSAELMEAIVTEEATMTPSPVPTVDDTPTGRGEVLFNTTVGGFACSTCHYATSRRLIGPGLAEIAERFETYGIEGTVEDYLLVSILNPREFIAQGEPPYPENIMPINYAELFTEEEIQDIIAYILSL